MEFIKCEKGKNKLIYNGLYKVYHNVLRDVFRKAGGLGPRAVNFGEHFDIIL